MKKPRTDGGSHPEELLSIVRRGDRDVPSVHWIPTRHGRMLVEARNPDQSYLHIAGVNTSEHVECYRDTGWALWRSYFKYPSGSHQRDTFVFMNYLDTDAVCEHLDADGDWHER